MYEWFRQSNICIVRGTLPYLSDKGANIDLFRMLIVTEFLRQRFPSLSQVQQNGPAYLFLLLLKTYHPYVLCIPSCMPCSLLSTLYADAYLRS